MTHLLSSLGDLSYRSRGRLARLTTLVAFVGALWVLMVWLPAAASAQSVGPPPLQPPDGVVTKLDGSGNRTITQGAEDYLRSLNRSKTDDWDAGKRKATETQAKELARAIAKADRRSLVGTLAKTAGKTGPAVRGVSRFVPYLGAGLLLYQVCDTISDGCWVFRQDQPPIEMANAKPWCRIGGDASEQVQRPDAAGNMHWIYPIGHFTLATGCVAADMWYYGGCSAVDGGGPYFGTHISLGQGLTDCPDSSDYVAWKAVALGIPAPEVLDFAEGDEMYGPFQKQHTVPDLLPEHAKKELAEELDKPENGRTRKYIASVLDELVENPYQDGTKVPRLLTNDTYHTYLAKLQAAGLVGSIRFANSYSPAPYGTAPGKVYEIAPGPGADVDVGTTVVVRAMPETGGETESAPETDPGGGTGGGGGTGTPGETSITTPTETSTAQCSVEWPNVDLSPLSAAGIVTEKWPFGFIPWMVEVLDDLTAVGAPLNVELPEIQGKKWQLNLAAYSDIAAKVRIALGFIGSILIISWITGLALGRKVERDGTDA